MDIKMNVKANTTPVLITAIASLIMLITLLPIQGDTAAPILVIEDYDRVPARP
ncbi:MAG: hypothetical protein AAFS01_16020 [Pseudomonadota bacterium]